MKRSIHSVGLKSIDNVFSGFANGELVLIGGRPTAGITQLLINLAIAFSEKGSVFYFVPNYLRSGIVNRITSSLSQIPMDRFVQKNFTANDTARLATLHFSSAMNRIHVHDSDTNSLAVLEALRQSLIEEYKLKLIIVDDLQALCHSTMRRKFIMGLKSIAEDFGVKVFLATEINKGVDTRIDKKPKLKDLPSGCLLAELPNKIILAHRPDYHNNLTELTIRKGYRQCPTYIVDPMVLNDCLKDG